MVIGGGLLGLEAARGLQSHGVDVTVVHSPQHLMNAQLGPEGGEILRQSMETLGIHVVCGNRATHVWGPDRVRGLRLKDGAEIECDLVVVAEVGRGDEVLEAGRDEARHELRDV